MAELFTREQARAWLRANNLKTGKSIQDAFINEIKGVLQEALEEEMNNTLGYSKYDYTNKNTDNSRNGHTKKTVKSQFGKIELDIPRDADSEHEPIIVKKHERTISSDLEGMIVSLFSQGLSNRDIESHMRKIYGLEVSAEMVTRITDKILPLAKEWQNRPLNELYPILYLDGIVFNVNKDGQVVKKTAYVVFAVTIEGKKDILGIWIGEAGATRSYIMNYQCVSPSIWGDPTEVCVSGNAEV
jgi:putative transposase